MSDIRYNGWLHRSGTGGVWQDSSGRVGVGTSTPNMSLHVLSSSDDVARLQSTSASNGPALTLDHIGASPADGDIIGKVVFNGEDDGANSTTYADIRAISTDVSNGSEDGDITFGTRAAGTYAERLRIDSSGRLIVGHTASFSVLGDKWLQVVGTDYDSSGISLMRFQDAASGASLILGHSRSGTKGTNTILQDGDELGKIRFAASDGSDTEQWGAGIAAQVDGTPSSGTDVPGRLLFFTASDGAGAGSERLRIDSDGKCKIPDNGRFSAGAGEDLYLYSDGTNGIIRAPNSNLYLQSDTAVILSDIGGNETFLKCTDDAGVEIYNNNKVVAKTDQWGMIVGDETTDQNAILIVKAAEARDAEIRYYSDQADDNADMWRGINAGNAMQYQTYATGSWEYRLLIGNGANGSIQCCATDQADITAGGISLGNANVGGKWYATGNTTASLFMFYNPANGNVGSIKTNGAATSFNTSSDYRLKENEVPLENAITKLKGLKPYTFNFKTSPSEKVDGFYAHEAAEVVPIAVTGTKDEMAPTYYKEGDTIPAGKYVGDWTGQYSGTEINPQGVDYSKFTPLLTKALQELVARVEALESA